MDDSYLNWLYWVATLGSLALVSCFKGCYTWVAPTAALV
jgi:hypothetical protein